MFVCPTYCVACLCRNLAGNMLPNLAIERRYVSGSLEELWVDLNGNTTTCLWCRVGIIPVSRGRPYLEWSDIHDSKVWKIRGFRLQMLTCAAGKRWGYTKHQSLCAYPTLLNSQNMPNVILELPFVHFGVHQICHRSQSHQARIAIDASPIFLLCLYVCFIPRNMQGNRFAVVPLNQFVGLTKLRHL